MARNPRPFGVTQETLTRRILKTFDAATPADLERGSSWYDRAGRIAANLVPLAGIDGITIEHTAAVLASFSPRTFWADNVSHATTFVMTSCAPKGAIGTNVDRARRVWESTDPLEELHTPHGPKTWRFARNIAGDREAVTVDVWACRVAGVDERHLSRKGAYDQLERAYQAAARRRGVDPVTMQATTWIVARNGRAY